MACEWRGDALRGEVFSTFYGLLYRQRSSGVVRFENVDALL